MSHTITDPAKMRTFECSGTKADVASRLQSELQGMSVGFKLVSFNYIINESNGMVTCFTVLELP